MKIVLASSNPGKIRELQEMLQALPIEIVPQSALGVSDADETGLSFIENAIIKARHAADITGLPAIADDAGIAVAALDGAPGIYSARYAGTKASSAENIQKLLTALENVPDGQRQACFYCVLAFVNHAKDPTPLICEGVWHGTILREPSGQGGFGYDPIFYVPSEGKSAAELTTAVKNRISHRGLALQSLLQKIPGKL